MTAGGASWYDDRPWSGLVGELSPRRPAPGDGTALALFRSAVEASPDAPAVHTVDRTLSFGDLDRHSESMAAFLAERGVGAGERVTISLQNVAAFPIAMLATWKLGGIVVPTNPMWKAQELDHLFGETQPRAYVAAAEILTPEIEAVALAHGVGTILVSGDDDLASSAGAAEGAHPTVQQALAHGGEAPPQPAIDIRTPAFITYTSGTTGLPKGAENSHAAVVFNAETYRRWADLGSDDACLAIAPLFHTTGLIAHMMASFAARMPLVLGGRFDPVVCADLLERHRPTFTIGAITVFRAILDELARRPGATPSLSKVYSGGAAMMPTTLDEFEATTGAYIHNVYGMTETTSPSHIVPRGLRAPVDPATGAISVGIPVDDTIVRIVDEHDQEVAPGELGELITEGPQVFTGYWRNPEATAAAKRGPGVRTGDIGYMSPEGWFFIIDRKKDMINASGFKVWPIEVENALLAHPGISEVAVVGAPDPYRGETVVAFVVPAPGAELSEAEVVAFGREQMAAYKYPRQVVLVPELPKNAGGKVLRAQLRQRAGELNSND